MDSGLALLRAKGGSFRSISKRLGIGHTSVAGWRRIPQDRILQIEKEFGIPREKLRPDLYQPKKGR